MNWKLVHKDPANQPPGNNPSEWKEQIAAECYHQCVYCSIHEKPWGGIDHYHIDHFRPKSKAEFEHLICDICNLFYACPVCNRFKSDDWPGEPSNLDVVCYPDPSHTNYADLFEHDVDTFLLRGKYIASKYLISRLYLNRPQLIFERRNEVLRNRHIEVQAAIRQLLERYDSEGKAPDSSLLQQMLELTMEITDHLHLGESIRPYKLADIRK